MGPLGSILGLVLLLFTFPQDPESPSDLSGRVINAFHDGPVTLLTIAPWENVVGYAICSVWVEEEMRNLQLRIGSNDQAKVLLNGREVLRFSKTRALEPDQTIAHDVVLKKGENLIVFKIANEKSDWGGCMRFVKANGSGSSPRWRSRRGLRRASRRGVWGSRTWRSGLVTRSGP